MIETAGGSANCLAPGVQVGEYRLLDVVGEGGFGIVYRARDISLDRLVAIKEYMPATLAGRKSSNDIHVRSQHRGAFDAGLRSFINEARLLAKFSHPALVHVYRFFECNGTAYMVMRHYEGQTFRTFLNHQPQLNQRTLSAIVSPVLDVLEMLHAADCYHRDIAPDNIFLQNNGMPVLLDFGAARRIIGDMTQALTMVLKPGFAPIEQYVDDGAMPQGAWTDIYQLGAMLYLAITGRAPATSVARMINDPLAPLTQDAHPGYSAQFLQGVHRALAVKPQDRPQNIAELKELLGISTMTSPIVAPWTSHEAPLVGRRAAQSAPPPVQDASGLPNGNDGRPAPATNPQAASAHAAPPAPLDFSATSGTHQRAADAPAMATSAPATHRKPVDSHRGTGQHQHGTASATHAFRPALTAGAWRLIIACTLVTAAAIAWWIIPTPTAPATAQTAVSQEEEDWAQARLSTNPAALESYVEKYPQGLYRSEAMAALNRMEVVEEAAKPAADATASAATTSPSAAPRSAAIEPPTPSNTGPVPAQPSQRNDIPAVAPAAADASASAPTLRPAAQPVKPAAGTQGRVVLRIAPWGNVSVNGAAVGTTPPLTHLELSEGTHRIEISNPVAPPVSRTVQVKKGEPVVFNHQFE